MKLTALIVAFGLTAVTATAEGIKPAPQPIDKPVHSDPKPAPPHLIPDDNSGGGVDLLPILLGVILVGIAASNRGAQPDLSEPRPQVRPQTCMSKVGGVDMIVACDD